MTEEQQQLVALGWEIRLGEKQHERWFALQPEKFPAAHDLHERGWLQRRVGHDVEWRLSDEGLSALRTDEVRASVSRN
jgi:hypothetical protein